MNALCSWDAIESKKVSAFAFDHLANCIMSAYAGVCVCDVPSHS